MIYYRYSTVLDDSALYDSAAVADKSGHQLRVVGQGGSHQSIHQVKQKQEVISRDLEFLLGLSANF